MILQYVTVIAYGIFSLRRGFV